MQKGKPVLSATYGEKATRKPNPAGGSNLRKTVRKAPRMTGRSARRGRR